mgnify:FL=1
MRHRAEAGFAAARKDYFGFWGISKPGLPELIERLHPHKGEAQFCRGYLACFRENGRLSQDGADSALEALANDNWLIDSFPRSWEQRD